MGTTQTAAPAFRVIWPNGDTIEARSATEFILRTAKAQWSETSFQEMKNQLSLRALGYPGGTGQYIHPYQGDVPFLMELARVGLFKLEVNGVKVVPRSK